MPNVRFLDIRFLFCLYLRQNANTTLSLQLPMKFSSIVRVETLRYLIKITTLRRKADYEQLKFLQPSIRLRYNYYVQLVAIRRDWMRVANLKSRQTTVAVARRPSPEPHDLARAIRPLLEPDDNRLNDQPANTINDSIDGLNQGGIDR